jgi:hypothetical protein
MGRHPLAILTAYAIKMNTCAMNDDEMFTLPLPPPPGGPHERVLFRRIVRGDEEEREDEDLMLRRVPRAVAQRFRASAGGRGLTHAQYLSALVELHESMRRKADAGDSETAAELERLGLTTVTV